MSRPRLHAHPAGSDAAGFAARWRAELAGAAATLDASADRCDRAHRDGDAVALRRALADHARTLDEVDARLRTTLADAIATRDARESATSSATGPALTPPSGGGTTR